MDDLVRDAELQSLLEVQSVALTCCDVLEYASFVARARLLGKELEAIGKAARLRQWERRLHVIGAILFLLIGCFWIIGCTFT